MNPDHLRAIKTFPALVSYLRDTLDWPIGPGTVLDDLTFDWSSDELRLADGHAARLQGGTVRQLRPFVPGQPWGIFLVEFADTQVYRTSLRQILRGLVPSRRRDANLQSWQHENLLFVCAKADYERFTFAHFKGDQAQRAKLATFGWRQGSAYVRTLLEHNLPHLAWPEDHGADPNSWQAAWAKAFDKEPVTRKFFDDFNDTFRKVCNDIANRHSRWSKETVEREAQTLLNRLLFLYFIQRKGWLNRDRQYLVSHFRQHYRDDPTGTCFLRDFLRPVFVRLSTKGPQADIPGHDLPFLNGGLFADEYGAEQRDDDVRRHHELKVGNDTFQHIFDDLLEAYNFTVREDTPLDVDVAIDPEMLGKIFESLVLQLEQSQVGGKSSRHDTGSYYTPRPIVHYLCRDALAAWLEGQLQSLKSRVQSPAAYELVNRKSQIETLLALDASQGLDPAGWEQLNSLLSAEEARALADAIQELRACDPAVGSGAFPVALLHELVNVARLAETRARGKDPVATDPLWIFDTKTRFIERALYGVDIQARAIEICKLRLWLGLVVDYPLDVDVDACDRQSFREALKRLPALPNLDFKIRRANSLIDTIHGEPVPLGKLHAGEKARLPLNRLITSKREFYRADSVPEKRKLRFAIYEATAELAQIELTAARNELGLLPDPANAEKVAELDQGQKEMAKVLAQIRDARKLKAADQDDALERLRAFFENEEKPTFVWQLDFAEVFHRAATSGVRRVVSLASDSRAAAGETRSAGQPPVYGSLVVREATEPQPSTQSGFDIVVANPPYLSFGLRGNKSATREWAERVRMLYPGSAEYKISVYALFLDLALRLLGAGGVACYITPDSFLLGRYFSKVRRTILDQSSVRTIVMFEKDFWKSGVVGRPTMISYQKSGTKGDVTAILTKSERTLDRGEHLSYRYAEKYFEGVPHNRFRLFFSPLAKRYVEAIEHGSLSLKSIARITTGVRSKIGQANVVSNVKRGPTWKKGITSGGQVLPYQVLWKGEYINIDPEILFAGGWDASLVERPKIMIRQTGDSIIAGLDHDHLYHLNNVHTLAPTKSDVSLPFVCALLNSRAINRYYHLVSLEKGRPMAQTDIETLDSVPYREVRGPDMAEIEALVARIKEDGSRERLDCIIAGLFELDRACPKR